MSDQSSIEYTDSVADVTPETKNPCSWVDVSCEADLESFYEQFGLRRLARGMGVRRPEALAAR